mmetsp:Transcript_126754/g.253400  ORF Transcript_126754/g.253400 Transcript_126754/m.253400 type:complete len:576 (-) Transcript_126754:59-1786(-)
MAMATTSLQLAVVFLFGMSCAIHSWAAASSVQPQRPLPRSAAIPVLQEPSVQDHYGFLRDYVEVPLGQFDANKGPPVLKVSNLDDATFQQLVRDGHPFVVEDCTKGFDADAISNFQCKDFADRWPTGNMRAEYTPGQYHIYLKDKNWYSKLAPQRAHREHMAGSAKIAGPYIWHVKDEEPLKTKRECQKHWRTPYFLKRSIANRVEANESFEFWFSMTGGGTFTHADAYCESTMSMQFRGKKRWRIQAFPEIKHYLNASSFGDEQIYDGKTHVSWTPESEVTVEPGQCFIFPTGYLHETFVDPKDNGNDASCFTAATFQFNHPRQVNLYRAYLSRFSMSHYGISEPCVSNMASYATVLGMGSMRINGMPEKSDVMTKAEAIVHEIDGDGDKHLTGAEFLKFGGAKNRRKQVLKEFRYPWMSLLTKKEMKEFEEEVMQVWAEDILQYHDLNRDKQVAVEELAHGLLQWHLVQYRMKVVRSYNSKHRKPANWVKETIAFEKDVLKRFYCEEGSSCKTLDEISAYGETLKGKKAKLKKQRIQNMFESEEGGDQEELMFVDRETGEAGSKKVGQIKAEL